jgi:hypothetical protein
MKNEGTNEMAKDMKAIDVRRSEIVEWYVECPKCCLVISDGIGNQVEHNKELNDGDIVICSCGTKIKVKA